MLALSTQTSAFGAPLLPVPPPSARVALRISELGRSTPLQLLQLQVRSRHSGHPTPDRKSNHPSSPLPFRLPKSPRPFSLLLLLPVLLTAQRRPRTPIALAAEALPSARQSLDRASTSRRKPVSLHRLSSRRRRMRSAPLARSRSGTASSLSSRAARCCIALALFAPDAARCWMLVGMHRSRARCGTLR